MRYLILILVFASVLAATARGESSFAQTLAARFECVLAKGAIAPALPSQSSLVLRYRICVEKKFSASQRDVLRRSFDLLIDRVVKPEVYACYRRQTAQLLTAGARTETFAEYVDHFFVKLLGSSALTGQEPHVFISQHATDHGGWGRLVSRHDFFESHEFAPHKGSVSRFVALSVRESAVGSPKVPFGDDTDFWAAAMGTALLHAQGAVSNQEMPAHSPLHEMAKCLLWSGKIPEKFQTRKEIAPEREENQK